LPKDDFYTPTDIDALQMENELLAFEIRFLKAQLADIQRLKKSHLAETQRLESRLEASERVEKDLVLLLSRLANSPLGWLFRFRRGFRTLEQKYLSKDA
jgi:Tfp pilus assembly protein PilN